MPVASLALAATCFSPSDANARGRFLLAADRAGARLDIFTHDMPRQSDLTRRCKPW